MKKLLDRVINIGVRPEYQLWEVHFARKINLIVFIAIPQMTTGLLFFEKCGYPQFVIDCVLGLCSLPVVLLLNAYKNYIWATYWFFCYGFCFFISLTLKMGMESFIILFYFPLIITMVQLLGRRETFKHLIILCCLCILSIIVITIAYKLMVYTIALSPEEISNLVVFNVIFSLSTTVAFSVVMASEAISQESLIKKTLEEKEILLAEVFHRVKNNLNIVTSLLNLKKNMSDSPEVQNALEDCRNRIFSMALVHQNLINSNNIVSLNFKDYIEKLVTEIERSFGESNTIEIFIETEDVNLELSNAIPCGLILNELITNSYKYARMENRKLQIQIKLKSQKEKVELEVKDNGPGLPEKFLNNVNTLGLELIRSLSEQINGTHTFYNKDGLVFNLQFKCKF